MRIFNSAAWLFIAGGVWLCTSGNALADPPPDETPPTTPGNFVATAISANQINLSWNASTDNKAVFNYTISQCQPNGSCAVIAATPVSVRTYSHTGLTSGATYRYQVFASDAAGNQSEPASAQATTPDNVPPTVPANLTATPAAGSKIDLTWSPSTDGSGIASYSIERCSGAGCGDFTPLSSTSTTSYSAVGLGSAISYSFRIRALDNAQLYSGYSQTATAISEDVTPPNAPSSLSAVAGASGTQANLTWTAPTDNVGVTGYLVESCTGTGCSNFGQIANIATTGYSVNGLAFSTSYSYRVKAYDAKANVSVASSVASVVMPNPPPPSAPASLSASAVSTTQINLSWAAASGHSGISGYQVDKCSGAGCTNFALLVNTPGTSFNATGLQPGTSYSFQVRAYDAIQYGSYSPKATAVTQGTPAPPNETITYKYDELGRLTKVTRAGTVNNGEQADYTYDASGNRTNVTVTAAP